MSLLVWLACAPAPVPADCTPATAADVRTRAGDYYRCVDRTLQDGAGCGRGGYPLCFGAKYADRSFFETWDGLSPAGQDFFVAVSPCLQARMAESIEPGSTCDAVWELGFSTHADCYVESGFCDLPTDDLLAINAMFDDADRELPEFGDQTSDVLAACAAR